MDSNRRKVQYKIEIIHGDIKNMTDYLQIVIKRIVQIFSKKTLKLMSKKLTIYFVQHNNKEKLLFYLSKERIILIRYLYY